MTTDRDELVAEIVGYVREKAAENGHLGTLYPASEILESVADLIAARFGMAGGSAEGKEERA